MRKCKYELYEDVKAGTTEDSQYEWVSYDGLFHEWGMDSADGEPHSAAIVENPSSGKIFVVSPNRITFMGGSDL